MIPQQFGIIAAADSPSALWLTLGIIAQLLVAAALVLYWASPNRAKNSPVPVVAVGIGITGVLLSGGYAIARGDWILAVGQLLVVLAGVTIMTAMKAAPEPNPSTRSRLPEVKPDSAEVKLSDLQPPL